MCVDPKVIYISENIVINNIFKLISNLAKFNHNLDFYVDSIYDTLLESSLVYSF